MSLTVAQRSAILALVGWVAIALAVRVSGESFPVAFLFALPPALGMYLMQWRAYASGWEHAGKAPASDLLKVLLLGLLIGLPVAGMLLLAVYAFYG